MEYSRWKNTISINLDATFLFTKHFIKNLDLNMDAPSIVLCGSTAGKFGEAYHSDYASSKSALMYGFINSVKNEIVKAHPRARINAVAPGWICTPKKVEIMKNKEIIYNALASTPLKKVSEPIDIVNSLVFLADSKLSGNITGVSLDINGGMEGRLLNSMDEFNKKIIRVTEFGI